MRNRFPAIDRQHWVKEKLRAWYWGHTAAAAEQHFQGITLNCESSDDGETRLWGRFLRQWRQEILGYFRFPLTNGFTEGCHIKNKLLKRLSYGYRNIQVYICKILLGFLPHSADALAPHLLT